MGVGASRSFRIQEKGCSGANVEATKDTPLTAATATAEGDAAKANKSFDREEPEAIEGVHEVVCRLAQVYPTQTPNRWDLITQNLNRTMKKKEIPAQSLKALFAKEGLCIPQCWRTEKENNVKDTALRAPAGKAADSTKRTFGVSLFEKKKTAADLGKLKKGGDSGGSTDLADDSDLELDFEIDKSVALGDTSAAGEGATGYTYQPLSKYEVFSLMRRVHDRVGAGVVETEQAVEDMEQAEKIVGVLYEHLSAETTKSMSQQNRIKAGLRHDSLVYGEMSIPHFLQVIVKLKRVHGHMSSVGGSFWDLGAGVGKLVIAASMMHNFESCYGVEILEDLRNASRPVLDRWRKEEVPKLKAAKANIRLDFMFADVMKQQGWVKEATLLFVHTNFSAVDLQELRTRAGGMQVGAICLSVSLAAVDDDKWGLLAEEHVDTSWGATKLYIHEKIAE